MFGFLRRRPREETNWPTDEDLIEERSSYYQIQALRHENEQLRKTLGVINARKRGYALDHNSIRSLNAASVDVPHGDPKQVWQANAWQQGADLNKMPRTQMETALQWREFIKSRDDGEQHGPPCSCHRH